MSGDATSRGGPRLGSTLSSEYRSRCRPHTPLFSPASRADLEQAIQAAATRQRTSETGENARTGAAAAVVVTVVLVVAALWWVGTALRRSVHLAGRGAVVHAGGRGTVATRTAGWGVGAALGTGRAVVRLAAHVGSVGRWVVALVGVVAGRRCGLVTTVGLLRGLRASAGAVGGRMVFGFGHGGRELGFFEMGSDSYPGSQTRSSVMIAGQEDARLDRW